MRTAITITRKHSSDQWELRSGLNVPIQKQIDDYRKLRVSQTNQTIAEVQLWESDGMRRVAVFKPEQKPETKTKKEL